MVSVAVATLKATSLLQQGQYKRAMEMLQSSLVGLRSRLEEGSSQRDKVTLADAANDLHYSDTEIRVLALHTSLHPTEEGMFPLRSQGFFSLYDRSLAIAFEDDDLDHGGDKAAPSTLDEHRLTSVVLYNMALCYHLRATQHHQGSSNDRFVRKAIRLYNLALELIHGNPASSPRSSDALVSLAVMNNLGHAYQHFNEVEHAQSCFDQLVSVLQSSPVMTAYDCIQDVNHFALTALLHDQVFPTAPAA
jgi:tetratricopeptide (TPR) repeat protein